MAITITRAPNGVEVSSNKVKTVSNVVFTTYTSGEENLTARMLGLTTIDFLEIEPSSFGGVTLVYDFNATTPKLHAYTAATPATNPGTEVAGATDLSWITPLKIRASGIS